jgi:hypothetical protein
MSESIQERLLKIHGDGICHICGKPKAGKGRSICSYPHGRLPVAPVNPAQPKGFWSWETPEMSEDVDGEEGDPPGAPAAGHNAG